MELPPHPYSCLEDFVDKTQEWLEAEWKAESGEYAHEIKSVSPAKLREDGVLISGLYVEKVTFTVFDRPLWHLCLAPPPRGPRYGPFYPRLPSLPKHKFATGSPAGISIGSNPLKDPPRFECSVHEITSRRIVVQPFLPRREDDPRVVANEVKAAHLLLINNEISIHRQRRAVSRLGGLSYMRFDRKKHLEDLIKCCFSSDDTVPTFSLGPLESLLQGERGARAFDFVNDVRLTDHTEDLEVLRGMLPNLNDSQRAAIAMTIRAKTFACIHGPPGTGKTTTLAHAIKLLSDLRPEGKILACAPSNTAVDNLMTACLKLGVGGCVRIGTETRVKDTLFPLCLERLVWECMTKNLVGRAGILPDELGHLKKLLALETGCASGADSTMMRTTKLQSLEKVYASRQQMRSEELLATREVLESARVLFSTCTGADNALLNLGLYGHKEGFLGVPKWTFDLVIIDEAAQALEAACWIPAPLGKRLLLAGDHHQLPPTIKSAHKEGTGLSLTLFERMIKRVGPAASQLLETQYRMHRDIMSWSSKNFYESRLRAGDGVPQDWKSLIPQKHLGKLDPEKLPPAMIWVDTVMLPGFHEDTAATKGSQQKSHSNDSEAMVVLGYLRWLRHLFDNDTLFQESVGVIAPYNGQVSLLKEILATDEVTAKVEVNSVDGFQGREKNIIVLSLVRSNSRKRIGFLSERRRLNVAITRARWHVGIIGDSDTTGSDPTLRDLYVWAKMHGQVRRADFYVRASASSEQKKQTRRKSLPNDVTNKRLYNAVPHLKKGDDLESSTDLTCRDRAYFHGRAARLGLKSRSTGKGASRKIDFTNGPLQAPSIVQRTSIPPPPPCPPAHPSSYPPPPPATRHVPPPPPPPPPPPRQPPPPPHRLTSPHAPRQCPPHPPPRLPSPLPSPADEEVFSPREGSLSTAMEHQTSCESTVSTSSTTTGPEE